MGRRGFFVSDEVFKGKTLSALEESRRGHGAITLLFGGSANLPCSIMRSSNQGNDIDGQKDGPAKRRNYADTGNLMRKYRNGEVSKHTYRLFRSSGIGGSSGALSLFPQNVGRTTILFYSNPGDVVVDPFAGHNSRMELCVRTGRHYIGCDLSSSFMEFNRKRADLLRAEFPSARIKLYQCDSRRMPVKDEAGSFTITSPPYYDIEYYGDESEQLGKSETYGLFLKGLGRVMQENFRTLRPGSFAVWFVNDFRKDGKMHFYHVDVMRLARKAGFLAHDLMVVDLGRGIRDNFPNQVFKSKILPKRHEYGLVFYKPGT